MYFSCKIHTRAHTYTDKGHIYTNRSPLSGLIRRKCFKILIKLNVWTKKHLFNAKECISKMKQKCHGIQKVKSTCNGRCKSNNVNNNIKDEWIKYSNQKAVIARLDERNIRRPNHMTLGGDTFFIQIYK